MTRFDLSTTRDEIITQALRKIVLGDGESATAAMKQNASTMLNFLLKQWAVEIPGFWNMKMYQLTLTSATSTIASPFPGEEVTSIIHVCYLDGSDYKPISIRPSSIWREESYEFQNSETGEPEIVTLSNSGDLLFAPTADKNYSISVECVRAEAEFDTGSDSPQFPTRYFLPAVFGLAHLLSFDYKVKPDVRNSLERSYKEFLAKAKRQEFRVSNDNIRKGGAYRICR